MKYKSLVVTLAFTGMLNLWAMNGQKTTLVHLPGEKVSYNYTFQVQNDEQMRLFHVIADGGSAHFGSLLSDAIAKNPNVVNEKVNSSLVLSFSDENEVSDGLPSQMTLMDWFVEVHNRELHNKFVRDEDRMFMVTKDLFLQSLSSGQKEMLEILKKHGAKTSKLTKVLEGVVEPLTVAMNSLQINQQESKTPIKYAPKPIKTVVPTITIPDTDMPTGELRYDAARSMYYYGRSLDEIPADQLRHPSEDEETKCIFNLGDENEAMQIDQKD